MRIRNAAIAGATAMTVALGGTTIASAEPDTELNSSGFTESSSADADTPSTDGESDKDGKSLSSKIGDSDLVDKGENDNKTTQLNGRDVFGSSKDFDNVPSWAKGFYALTILGSIGSVIGLIVGPLANYLKFGR